MKRRTFIQLMSSSIVALYAGIPSIEKRPSIVPLTEEYGRGIMMSIGQLESATEEGIVKLVQRHLPMLKHQIELSMPAGHFVELRMDLNHNFGRFVSITWHYSPYNDIDYSDEFAKVEEIGYGRYSLGVLKS